MRAYLFSSAAARRALLGLSLAAAGACSSAGDSNDVALNPGGDLPSHGPMLDLPSSKQQGNREQSAPKESPLEREASAGAPNDDSE